MILPLIINQYNRISVGLLCIVVFFLGYSIPNHFHYYQPQLLTLTTFEKSIPLIPWSVFIYLSEYILFFNAYFHFKEEINRNRYMWAYFAVILIGAVFYVFFPTTYPRHDYPLPENLFEPIRIAFTILRAADDPSNCFPSMHVTCCFLTALAFLAEGESRKRFWFYLVWASLIAASTLPTKQHYLADVLAGVILAVFSYWFFFKKIKYVSTAEYSQRVRTSLESVSDFGNE